LNRSKERAVELADSVGATVRDFTELNDALHHADVLLTSTGSGEVVVTADALSSARSSIGDRPLLIVDIAVPRDVEHAAGNLPGVTLRDLHDLRDWAQQGIAARAQETDEVRSIILQEVARFGEAMVERQAAPLIAELHERAEQIRQAEVERYVARHGGLTKEDRDAVETLTKSIVAKLLHSPSMQLKNNAGTPQGERISDALRDLFDIE
jgi:glutamyl-tRNA reductase